MFYWKDRPNHEYFYSQKIYQNQIYVSFFWNVKLSVHISEDILIWGRVSRRQFDGCKHVYKPLSITTLDWFGNDLS